MEVITTREALKQYLQPFHWAGGSIGFVPTMGALHAGHLSLMRQAVTENKIAVASIFVNPTQFGQNEDFAKYPRAFEADCELLTAAGIQAVFAPKPAEMYASHEEVRIFFPSLSGILCDKFRPGHFEGVARIVMKLLLLVQPSRSYFGQKDFQQVVLIQKLAQEFCMSTQIVSCPIIREPDGLALSSRNRYLSAEEREQARILFGILNAARTAVQDNATIEAVVQQMHVRCVEAAYFKLQYAEIRNGYTLAPVTTLEPSQRPVALLAGYIGATRLIDNMFLLD